MQGRIKPTVYMRCKVQARKNQTNSKYGKCMHGVQLPQDQYKHAVHQIGKMQEIDMQHQA